MIFPFNNNLNKFSSFISLIAQWAITFLLKRCIFSLGDPLNSYGISRMANLAMAVRYDLFIYLWFTSSSSLSLLTAASLLILFPALSAFSLLSISSSSSSTISLIIILSNNSSCKASCNDNVFCILYRVLSFLMQ